MTRTFAWILTCATVGLVLWVAAPRRWGFTPMDGLMVGGVLYIAALRRFLEQEGAARSRSLAFGLASRAALFLALLVAQAYVCFEALPGVDVRRGFIVLSSWILTQSLVDRGAARREWGARA